MIRLFPVSIAALILASACPAAWLTVTDRAQLGASDRVGWAATAGNYELLGAQFAATSESGIQVAVSQAGAAFYRLNQSAGWFGNFTPGEELLWSYFGGAISLNFGPVGLTALGFQIQPDLYGDYTAQLEVFDAAGRLMALATGNGNSTALGDGTALYLGILGDSTFHSARISLIAGDTLDSFAVNAIDFSGAPMQAPVTANWATLPLQTSASAVPEPATFFLAMVAVGGVALARRRL